MDRVAAVERVEVDGSELAVGFEVGGFVDEGVLAAELVFNGVEADGEIVEAAREEGAAAGFVGHFFEDIVAVLVGSGIDVSADGVDGGLRSLALADGVAEVGVALVVVAVGDEDDGAADVKGSAGGIEELVLAGAVDGVVEGGSSAWGELLDGIVEFAEVVGPALHEVWSDVEAFDEGLVRRGAEDLQEEAVDGLLLELEALADGVAGVDEDAQAQRELGLLGEAVDLSGRAMIVEEGEVAFLEIFDELAAAVGDGEDEVHFVDVGGELVLGGCGLSRGRAILHGGELVFVPGVRGLVRLSKSAKGESQKQGKRSEGSRG